MQIKNIKISELKPYENNPRKNDEAVKYVANSIREFGFKVPLVVDKDNVIVAGHTRYKASIELGLSEVPCIIADDLTDEQIKAFRLADNKVGEIAEWDLEMLDFELEGIEDLNMEEFGFELNAIEEEKEVEEDDFDCTPPEEPKAKLGDIYQLGSHRLMCGDSTKAEDINKLIDGQHINLFLSDPPYGIDVVKGNKIGDKSFGKIGGGKIVESNNYIPIKGDDTTETAEKNYNIVKELSNNQIIFGGNYFTEFLEPKSCWIVWDKQNTGNFADVELAWSSFDKGAKLYKWLWNGLCRKGDRKTEGAKRVHPTQKPVGLIGDILKDFSVENDNILDCFGGSDSTLIACEQLNRNCFMIEYEPSYIDVIINRWETYTGKKAIKLN